MIHDPNFWFGLAMGAAAIVSIALVLVLVVMWRADNIP
jgi:hypothetical protein